MTDEITLTIPSEREARGVAHLVLGGLAVRLDLTIENLEDLELAIDAILGRLGQNAADEITVRLRLMDGSLEVMIGPLPDRVLDELEREPDDGLGLRRVLDGTVDDVHVDGESVRLTKAVPAR
jgi:anti-sigma regulatory factor (Ser/Thr protein kinase)